MMTTTPPGWYDDGHGALRWWDGTQWTEHVAQPDAESSPAPTEAEIVAQLGFEQEPVGATESSAARVEAGAVPGSAGQPETPAQPAYPSAQQYPSAPSGYPQGVYPGAPGAPAGGGFTAATEPRSKSKLWIVWVVLGVVLLGIVIAAAVVIPLLLLSASTANSAGQSDDERAAVATVGLYDDAWQEGDCDSFNAVTTEDFRATNGFGDCATLQSQSAAFGETFDDYEVNITDVETIGEDIIVTTQETYTALVDESGNPIEPAPGQTVYHYTLVQVGGDWVVNGLTYETE